MTMVALPATGAPPPAAQPAPAPPAAPATSVPGDDSQANGLGPLTGRLFAHLRVPTSSTATPIQQASTSIWISARPRFTEATSAKITLTADALYSSLDPTTTLRAAIREGYVHARAKGWDLRVGQQILPWGNADGVNPTDFLTAKDFAFFSADPEVRRFGALSMRLGWTPNGGDSPLEFVLVAQPIYPSSRLLVPGGLLPAGVTDAGLVRPTMSIGSVETAARIGLHESGWDLAIVAFRGYNHTPQYYLAAYDVATSAIRVATTNQQELAAGLEASATAGRWIFRAEGAFVTNKNATMTDTSIEPMHLDGVIGIERAFGERFRAQAQGIVRYHPYFYPVAAAPNADPAVTAIEQTLAQTNALLLNYQDRTRPAASVRLSYSSEEDTVEAEVLVFANVGSDPSRFNYLVRPVATYRCSDALKLQLGAEIYGGPGDTPLGALSSLSGGFFEASYAY